MEHSLNRQCAAGILLSLALVLGVSMAARAFAAASDLPMPSKENYAWLEQVKANQKILAKTRDEHTSFMDAKNGNAELVAKLNADGWNIDWATLKLIPSFR